MEQLNRPLAGVKIVELATFIAAPSCGPIWPTWARRW